jgi:membrane associated rhomboid family serine protease
VSQPKRIPYVTLILIAVNILTAFIVLVQPDKVEKLGFSPSSPNPLSLVTSLFVHANAVHLMGNMVFLAAVGVAVEIATGSGRFSAVYFLSGLLGVLTFWVAVRRLEEVPPLVGASGAIAGCATYYSLRYTKFRVPLAPKASVTVAWITLIWIALQVGGALIRIGEPIHASGFLAHLGGGIAGVLLGLFFKAPDLGSRRLGHQVYEALNDMGPAAQIEHLKLHLKDHPDDLEMHVKLAEEYAELGDTKDEAATYLGVLGKLEGDNLDRIVQRLLKLKALQDMAPVKKRQLADRVSPQTAMTLLTSMLNLPKADSQRPEVLMDLMKLAPQDSPIFENARADFLADYANHPLMDIAKQNGWLG